MDTINNSNRYTTETITYITGWTENLFSFRTTRYKEFKFIPGQFARIGILKEDNKIVWRPYSIVSAPHDEFLEFYSIVVPNGEFTQRLKNLQIGDHVYVDKTNYGLLTTSRFEGGSHLWLLSTGTGLAPFISILYDLEIWHKYSKIILVHCARKLVELTYQDTIKQFFEHEPYRNLVKDKLIYVKFLTQEHHGAHLYGRITNSLIDHSLEEYVGIPIDVEHSRVMICGNPQMVDTTRKILSERGLTISKRSNPGNMAVENYW